MTRPERILLAVCALLFGAGTALLIKGAVDLWRKPWTDFTGKWDVPA